MEDESSRRVTSNQQRLIFIVVGFLCCLRLVRENRTISIVPSSSTVYVMAKVGKSRHGFDYNRLIEMLLANKVKIDQVPDVFPHPTHNETVTVYNYDAWKELVELVTTRDNFTIVPNGGSSTAGGGLKAGDKRFGPKLVDYLLAYNVTKSPNTTITNIPRGHGTRHTLHSSLVLPSYIPQNTDIVLWEFATNDYGYNLNNQQRKKEHVNQLIVWLDELKQIQPKPPLVILAYLWKTGFQYSDKGIPKNQVFDDHKALREQYDFVVGHVNLGYYMRDLHMDYNTAKKIFLADTHHPRAMGHAVLAFLMLNLIQDETRAEEARSKRRIRDDSTQKNKLEFEWACGNDTTDKRFIQSRVQRTPGASPHPLAAFTNEIPKNTEPAPRILLQPDKGRKQVLIGKASPLRLDRQMATTLPCCGASNDTLDFVIQSPLESGMQALQLGTSRYEGPIQVYLDDMAEPAKGHMIQVSRWPCLWNFKDIYDNAHWFAFEQEWEKVSRLRLCSVDKRCRANPNATESKTDLLSLIVF